MHAQASIWANALLKSGAAATGELVNLAYRQAFGRDPEPWEAEAAVGFIESQKKEAGNDSLKEPLADLCHTLFNVKEFVFVN